MISTLELLIKYKTVTFDQKTGIEMISFLFFSFVSGKLVTEKPSADVNSILVKFNTTEKLNVVGMDHPYVCANFDWWPDTKCDYGNCSWVGNGVNKIDFENKILIQVINSFLNWIIFFVPGSNCAITKSSWTFANWRIAPRFCDIRF